MNRKSLKWLVRFSVCMTGSVAATVILFLFCFIFVKGHTVLYVPIPAIIGSLYLGGVSAFIGGILGAFCAVYLSFSSKKGMIHKVIQMAVSALSGIPSILFGMVGYTFLIYKWGMNRCLLSAAITIAVMILPFITIRVKKILDETGKNIMKESLVLGISKEYALRKQILPSCMVEVISAIILGMAYGMGAVAPILYTGVVMQAGVPQKLTDPFMSLPYHLYMLVTNGYPLEYAYGTAFVLIVMLLGIQILCKSIVYFIGNRKGKKL